MAICRHTIIVSNSICVCLKMTRMCQRNNTYVSIHVTHTSQVRNTYVSFYGTYMCHKIPLLSLLIVWLAIAFILSIVYLRELPFLEEERT